MLCGPEMPVWVGHSCPTLLTLLSHETAVETFHYYEIQRQRRRKRVPDPHESC
jgi:hypothetical protein